MAKISERWRRRLVFASIVATLFLLSSFSIFAHEDTTMTISPIRLVAFFSRHLRRWFPFSDYNAGQFGGGCSGSGRKGGSSVVSRLHFGPNGPYCAKYLYFAQGRMSVAPSTPVLMPQTATEREMNSEPAGGAGFTNMEIYQHLVSSGGSANPAQQQQQAPTKSGMVEFMYRQILANVTIAAGGLNFDCPISQGWSSSCIARSWPM